MNESLDLRFRIWPAACFFCFFGYSGPKQRWNGRRQLYETCLWGNDMWKYCAAIITAAGAACLTACSPSQGELTPARAASERESKHAISATHAVPSEERHTNVDGEQLHATASAYAALMTEAATSRVDISALMPAMVSNMPYMLLMPLRQRLYEMEGSQGRGKEMEAIARLLLHCTNMSVYQHARLLGLLGESLRAQGRLEEACDAYKQVLMDHERAGVPEADGLAISACVALQALAETAGDRDAQLSYARAGYEIALRHTEYPGLRDAPVFVYVEALLDNERYDDAAHVLRDTPWTKEGSKETAARMLADLPAHRQRNDEQRRLREGTMGEYIPTDSATHNDTRVNSVWFGTGRYQRSDRG